MSKQDREQKRRDEIAIMRLFLGQQIGIGNHVLDYRTEDKPDFLIINKQRKDMRIAVEVTRLTSEKVMQFYGNRPEEGSHHISYPMEWHFFFRKILHAKRDRVETYKKNSNAEKCWLVIMPTFESSTPNIISQINQLNDGECFVQRQPIRVMSVANEKKGASNRSSSPAKNGNIQGRIKKIEAKIPQKIDIDTMHMRFERIMAGPSLQIEPPMGNDMINFGRYVFNNNSHDFSKVFVWDYQYERFEVIYDEDDSAKYLMEDAKPEYQYGIRYTLVISTNKIEAIAGQPIPAFPTPKSKEVIKPQHATELYFRDFPLGSTGIIMDIDSLWRIVSFKIDKYDERIGEERTAGPILVDMLQGKRRFWVNYKAPGGFEFITHVICDFKDVPKYGAFTLQFPGGKNGNP